MKAPVRSAALALFLATLPGCYLSHGRDDAGVGTDARVRDAGPDARPPRLDAGADASTGACCTRWVFDRRVAIDDFEDETVTPRLFASGGRVGVVVTGPDDPAGPSGAHYLRFSSDLSAHEPPVPVTMGSFTWGQPASRGDRFAVCWGTGGMGNMVRLYDLAGDPLSEQATLEPSVESPCVASAYSEGRFAFAFAQLDPVTRGPRLRVRLVDAESGAVGGSFDAPLRSGEISVALAGIDGGLAVAIAGESTRVFLIDGEARPIATAAMPVSRRVRAFGDGGSLTLLRVFSRLLEAGREEDVWAQDRVDVPSLGIAGTIELGTFEPPPSPGFAATRGSCGEAVLALALPALGVADGSSLHTYSPGAPLPGPLRGDTSALVIDEDAYVAFTAVDPGTSRAAVQIDRWVCGAH